MKRNKRNLDNLGAGNGMLHTTSRKEKRQAEKKEKKIKKAINYAKVNNTNKVSINSNDLSNVTILKNSTNVFSALGNKILTNGGSEENVKKSKKKKKKKKKKNGTDPPVEKKSASGDEGDSFKLSNNTSMRLARLQEYVNKETNKAEIKSDKEEKKNSSNLIKDKYKLKDLQYGLDKDQKTINMYARKLNLVAFHKKKVHPLFAEDFGDILEDIEEGSFDLKKYKNDPFIDSKDDLKDDLLIAMGSKNVDRKGKKTTGNEVPNQTDEGFSEEDETSSADEGCESDDCRDDEEDSNCVEEESECEGSESDDNFLDDQAEEDNASEDENEIVDDTEEIMFASGSTLTTKQDLIACSEPTINSIFDMHVSSSSESGDSDLDGFIVDDNFVEYDSEEEIHSNRKKKKKKSRIVGRDKRDSISDIEVVEGMLEEPLMRKAKRKRIQSDDSDFSQNEISNLDSPEKGVQKSSAANRFSEGKNIKLNNQAHQKLKSNNLINEKEESTEVNESSRDKNIKKLKNGLNKKLKSDVQANKTESINISDGEIISGTQSKLENKKKKGKPILKKKNEQENTKANQKKRVSFSETNEGEESVEVEVEEKGVASSSGEEYHEDIYGRLRDKEGKIVSAPEVASKETNGKYIPPAMRKLMELNNDEKKKEQLAALQRRLKGLLNRLAESNIAGIVSQIEAFYKTNSRNDMDESITKLLFEMLITPILTPERLCQEYALLVAVLTANVGPEVGAHILTEFVLKWVEELEAFQPAASDKEIESKELDNKLMFVCHLYNFKVIDATLVYDLLHKILERDLGAKEVELILLVLRSVGFTLRKDDPLRLKRFITDIQAKSSDRAAPESDPSYSRLQFMLEVLTAIKNNNISKVPNYDPTHTQHLKTTMKGLIRKGCRTSDLKISLEDLVKSKVVGKWWVVGSAWSGGLKEEMNPSQENQAAKLAPVESSFPLHNFSDNFKKRAAKLQMNRPPRINILYAITEGSDSPDEACEKLIQLNLPPSQEREICSVMIQCCMRAKEHTPFHALLAFKLCKFKKAFSRLFQFSLWDQFNVLDDMKAARAANLAKFSAHLIAEDCLNLSLFKTLNFAEADKKMVSFLRQSLIALLLYPTGIYAVTRAFNHLSSSPKLKVLRQYIRLFILKFINPKDTEEKDMKVLQSRIKLALDTLSSIGGVTM